MQAMQKLKREDLWSLEDYHRERPGFRRKVMAHKRDRIVPLGPNATLHFEDRLTMHYQVQEMLRAERIYEPEAIQEELDAYNPLIPDGTNWKATFMVEYDDPEVRREMLSRLVGIEDKAWVRVGDLPKVYAIADEDLERDQPGKTSSVHFLRFELTPEMIAAAKAGAPIAVGVEHPLYTHAVDPVPENVRASLVRDLA